jgi:superfamily II DNA helicase RecQ
MVEYCEGKPGCKRKRLLEYFGENTLRLVCNNCDYCIDREKVTKSIKAFNSTERTFAKYCTCARFPPLPLACEILVG